MTTDTELMRVRFISGSRPKPRTGDRRWTKKHGLQIRVPETHDGMWVRRGGRQSFEWRALGALVGTPFAYLIPLPTAYPAPWQPTPK